jgi:hypothetical protein
MIPVPFISPPLFLLRSLFSPAKQETGIGLAFGVFMLVFCLALIVGQNDSHKANDF